jgi:hypothetical protein
MTDMEAAYLAGAIRDAQSSGDTQRLKQLVGSLYSPKSSMNDRDYQEFSREFFTHLGPDDTLKVLDHIKDDDRLLQIYDLSLATATNSSWDPSFNARLWPPGLPLGELELDRELLLKYGIYSADALTRAGDHFLLSDVAEWSGAIVWEALARNPQAALRYLLGMADAQDGLGPRRRMDTFAEHWVWTNSFHGPAVLWPDQAYGDMLTAVSRIATDRQAGEILYSFFHTPDHPSSFDRLIPASNWFAAAPQNVPDGIRHGIAALIASHPGVIFAATDKAHRGFTFKGVDGSWQTAALKAALIDHGGNVIPNDLNAILVGIQQHADFPMPIANPDHDSGQWRIWSEMIGARYGEVLHTIGDSYFGNAIATLERADQGKELVDLILIPEQEIGGKVVSFMVNWGLDLLGREVAKAWLDAHPKEAVGAARAENRDEAMWMFGELRRDMTATFLQAHGIMSADDPRFQATVKRVATETHDDDPQLNGFINNLNDASIPLLEGGY